MWCMESDWSNKHLDLSSPVRCYTGTCTVLGFGVFVCVEKYWDFWKMLFSWVSHFFIFYFFASFPWQQFKVYWLARMGQNFDQAKRDNTFWPWPNILNGIVWLPIFTKSNNGKVNPKLWFVNLFAVLLAEHWLFWFHSTKNFKNVFG